ncbi:hypothetical protein COBT_003630, partial [Conglomerata obtusa]
SYSKKTHINKFKKWKKIMLERYNREQLLSKDIVPNELNVSRILEKSFVQKDVVTNDILPFCTKLNIFEESGKSKKNTATKDLIVQKKKQTISIKNYVELIKYNLIQKSEIRMSYQQEESSNNYLCSNINSIIDIVRCVEEIVSKNLLKLCTLTKIEFLNKLYNKNNLNSFKYKNMGKNYCINAKAINEVFKTININVEKNKTPL